MEIESKDQLYEQFVAQTAEERDWEWELSAQSPPDLVLHIDGLRRVFELKAIVNHHDLKLEEFARKRDKAVLLLVPKLTGRFLEKCKKHGVSVMDLNGRAWIRDKGILIDRATVPGRRFRTSKHPSNIFEGKSERLVRTLLTDRDREWTQADLIGHTEASQALVSRVLNFCVGEGYLLKPSDRTYRVDASLRLLDAWAAARRLKDRVRCVRYSSLEIDPWYWVERLNEWVDSTDPTVSLAYTQWLAAWDRHGYTEPQVCTAYVSRLPTPDESESMGLREVSSGGCLWLYKPKDPGVFLLPPQHGLGRELVSDAQIYVDLQNSGLRGPEAADALKAWEGFCRT